MPCSAVIQMRRRVNRAGSLGRKLAPHCARMEGHEISRLSAGAGTMPSGKTVRDVTRSGFSMPGTPKLAITPVDPFLERTSLKYFRAEMPSGGIDIRDSPPQKARQQGRIG